jgi:hypothetical protein
MYVHEEELCYVYKGLIVFPRKKKQLCETCALYLFQTIKFMPNVEYAKYVTTGVRLKSTQ